MYWWCLSWPSKGPTTGQEELAKPPEPTGLSVGVTPPKVPGSGTPKAPSSIPEAPGRARGSPQATGAGRHGQGLGRRRGPGWAGGLRRLGSPSWAVPGEPPRPAVQGSHVQSPARPHHAHRGRGFAQHKLYMVLVGGAGVGTPLKGRSLGDTVLPLEGVSMGAWPRRGAGRGAGRFPSKGGSVGGGGGRRCWERRYRGLGWGTPGTRGDVVSEGNPPSVPIVGRVSGAAVALVVAETRVVPAGGGWGAAVAVGGPLGAPHGPGVHGCEGTPVLPVAGGARVWVAPGCPLPSPCWFGGMGGVH